MEFGLLNNCGKWEIPSNIIDNMSREYPIDWMFYYNIEIKSLEDIEKLISVFDGITISLDPTTTHKYVIVIHKNFNLNNTSKDEVPF